MARVEVEARGDQAPRGVKRGTNAPDAARLAHEAEVLDAIRGDGVVRLVGFRAAGAGAELTGAWAGHHTLATVGNLSTTVAAQLVLDVADTVERLHRLQIAHTRLAPEHIVVGADGRPVL